MEKLEKWQAGVGVSFEQEKRKNDRAAERKNKNRVEGRVEETREIA